MNEFRILNAPPPILNAARSVEMAAAIAIDFTSLTGGHAIVAAQRAGIDRHAFQRLTQPSRRPKHIAVDLWCRLIDAYARSLRRELARIEAEIRRVEALGAPLGALEDLLDQADGVADRIRHVIEKRG